MTRAAIWTVGIFLLLALFVFVLVGTQGGWLWSISISDM